MTAYAMRLMVLWDRMREGVIRVRQTDNGIHRLTDSVIHRTDRQCQSFGRHILAQIDIYRESWGKLMEVTSGTG